MTDLTHTRRRRWLGRWLLLVLAFTGSLAIASPAAAHLDLVSVSPADGAVLQDPAAAITVTFTKTATPAGGGFTLFDAQGEDVPVDVSTDDDGVTWKVQPVAALTPTARYGLRWSVAADDSHPKSGTAIFRVAGSAATEAGAETTPAADGDAANDAGSHEQMPGHTSDTENPTGEHTDGHTAAPGGTEPGSVDRISADLEPGLAAALADADSTSTTVAAVAGLARWISFAGILVAVGALIVVVSTLVGSTGDVRLSERVIRVAAGLAAGAALVEGLCLFWTVGTDLSWRSVAAVGLRVLAGSALALRLRLVPLSSGGRRSHDVYALPAWTEAEYRGSSGGTRSSQMVLTPPVRTGRVRGVPSNRPMMALFCAALLISFGFDGHTATESGIGLILAAALAHTLAAAVWVGGVVLLAVLLLVRARAGVPTGAGELAVRFSVPATAAVVVAGLAGVGLTLLIMDDLSDLTGTEWGRVLLVKIGLVVVVAIMGYINNRYALPALDAWHPGTARVLRRTVAAEAVVMILVLLVTAVLVVSDI